MDKVIEKGIKVDLHIHSCFSSKKDGEKVKNNTIENLHVLIEKLNENNVNMCSITDHDNFNYEMYRKLKEEEGKNNSIKKVLPGVEFSVEFNLENKSKVIHIVTIFDDKDEEKVKSIENIFINGKGKSLYNNKNQSYSEEAYLSILREINLDMVMIAHQKNSLLSDSKPKANDVLSLGQENFNNLLFMEYFDAYEFRNKKNDIFNKVYIFQHKVEEKLRFVTGSDCHKWTYYPNNDEFRSNGFEFTFIKALPTFRGLAMAMTDIHRIKMNDSFFNPSAYYMKSINMIIKGKRVDIPLSRGLNVIIGDNSVGKSMLLHALTNNNKLTGNKAKILNGYNKYLQENGIEISSVIEQENIFEFNAQGEVRKLFEETEVKANKYLERFFPKAINASKYKSSVEKEFNRLINCLEKKFNYDDSIKDLSKFKIAINENNLKSITLVGQMKGTNDSNLKELTDDFELLQKQLDKIKNNKAIQEKDKEIIENSIETYNLMHKKYLALLEDLNIEKKKINIYNTYIKHFKDEYMKKVSDEQKLNSEFLENRKSVVNDIVNLIKEQQFLKKFEFDIETCEINPEQNPVDKYVFVSKLGVERIDKNYLKKVLQDILRKDKEIDTTTITRKELQDIIKNYPSDVNDPCKVLKEKINSKLDKDFKPLNAIVENKMDIYKDLSEGFNSQIYFTLLSGETKNKGIYLIDQPEDHISQKAIKDYVLEQFRNMGMHRQVIMVTHNPQFIVNLDVDNVIFLTKNDDDFEVLSGALEYEELNYSILKIVADNIEGGLETISRRLKRYEKDI